MDHYPIDSEARGKVRAWRRTITNCHARIERHITAQTTQRLAREFALKTSVTGRRRAFDKLHRLFSGPTTTLEKLQLTGRHPIALWASLTPRTAPRLYAKYLDPGRAGDCVCVHYIVAGAMPNGHAMADGLWTIEVPTHALERLAQRDRKCDLSQVLFAAHHRTLDTAAKTVQPCMAARRDDNLRFILPAGNGAFICDMSAYLDASLGLEQGLHVFAVTWVHEDTFFPEQERAIAADIGAVGGRLRDNWLVPVPYRRIVPTGRRDGEAEPHVWEPYLAMTADLSRPAGTA
jgi:hypothetical protein